MTSLSAIKKSNSLEKLTRAMESANSGGAAKRDDDRFWTPEVDKSGNGYAVIRFLYNPAVDGDDGLPFIQIWNHGFQGPGGWYIENCATSINGKCPVCEHNNKLWSTGLEANKEIVRKQKRKLTYISNILVLTDPKRPENEGKVFLYKYGKKIFEKINAKLAPAFQDEEKFSPYDFWTGANFKLKIRNYEGYRNYDMSEFESQSALFGGDESKLDVVWKASYSLKEFLAESNFKPYDELKDKLDRVLGAGGSTRATAPRVEEEEAPWEEPKAAKPRKTAEAVSVDEDDDLSYFDKLAAD